MSSGQRTPKNPNVRLRLAGRAENILLVRELLAGLSERLRLDIDTRDDIRTAVTEACNNVVQHAYTGEEGPIEVDVHVLSGTIEVTVRDHGLGIRPRIRSPASQTLGVGLMVIEYLSQTVELNNQDDGGLEVRMSFATPNAQSVDALGEERQPDDFPATSDGSSLSMSIGPPQLASTILPRLLSAIAASAHLSTDRISDLMILAETLATHAPKSLYGSRLNTSLGTSARRVELSVGPLRRGGARQLLEDATVPEIGPLIETLADDYRAAADGTGEVLLIGVSDHVR